MPASTSVAHTWAVCTCSSSLANSWGCARAAVGLALQLFHRQPCQVSLSEDGVRLLAVMQTTMDERSGAIASRLTRDVQPAVAQVRVVDVAREGGDLDVRVGDEMAPHLIARC